MHNLHERYRSIPFHNSSHQIVQITVTRAVEYNVLRAELGYFNVSGMLRIE